MPAILAPEAAPDNRFTRSVPGLVGILFLIVMVAACLGSLPWTLAPAPGNAADGAVPRYNEGDPGAGRLPPAWWPPDEEQTARLRALAPDDAIQRIAAQHHATPEDVRDGRVPEAAAAVLKAAPRPFLGTDVLGRSLLIRCLTGGGISLGIGIAAACISVFIGTIYGGLAGYLGGKTDAVLMRIVDILYGLPYVLLVVLLAVASDAIVEESVSRAGSRDAWATSTLAEIAAARPRDAPPRLDEPPAPDEPFTSELASRVAHASKLTEPEALQRLQPRDGETRGAILDAAALIARPPRDIAPSTRALLDVGTLLFAIGGVSWLTMARVIRGQVLSLKGQPFIEAARAAGAAPQRIFLRHLLPNLLGPIIVYATLTVPQAILQESFLSFLGIGVKPPLPSWGNLAAEGLSELNSYHSNWWLLFFPCLLLALALLALNFVGEGLREAFDPKRARR